MSRADEPDAPPRPSEILDEAPHQRMSDLDDEEYQQLAEDIRENGVIKPVITDDDGEIIDGHHRVAIATHYGIEYDTKPLSDLEDDEKIATALKLNISGRSVDDGTKRYAVKEYIKAQWPRDDEGQILVDETDAEVAEKLRVSKSTVGRARRELGNSGQLKDIPQARYLARKYYEKNPDASFREIGREFDVGHKTVSHWLKKDVEELREPGDDENGGDDEPEPEPETKTEPESGSEPEAASNAAPRAEPVAGGSRSEGSVTTVSSHDGVDSRRGILDGYNTDDILGGAEHDDSSTSPSARPISFANEHPREQLVDHGVVVTFRAAKQPTGIRPWNTRFGDPTEGAVIVAGIGEIDPTEDTLEEYVHLSGFESGEEWREAIGVADDEDAAHVAEGHLYLAVENDREGAE